MTYVYDDSLCTRTIIFGETRICQLPAMGNGDIRSISVVLSVLVYYILGYDVPTCGSRVPSIYLVFVISTVHIYVVVGYLWMEYGWCGLYCYIYMYCWRLGLAESRHLEYLYVLVAAFILRRSVPIFGLGGLLSVK